MPNPLDGKTVALGVSGSIACHKAVDLASKLTQQGAMVDVVMTEAATRFASPLAFGSITHRPVVTDIFDPRTELGIDHVAIAERADIVVVAPATANTIARMAQGLAGDALTTTVLATRAPVVVCPAMDGHMYDNPATQHNVETLRSRGITVAGPAVGRLASGMTGSGRMIEPAEIIGHIRAVLGRDGDLAGRKVVSTAGGTREPIDPVRSVSNRSSGKMGYAVAEAARDRGAAVTLVTAPTSLPIPVGVDVVRVESAADMRDALARECQDAAILVMAAAVADWRPAEASESKLKKGSADTLSLELTRTPDVVAGVDSDGLVKVGFAAETDDLEQNARAKIAPKGLHFIAANDVTEPDSGFGSDTNRVILIDREGRTEKLDLLTKYEVAHRILDKALTYCNS